MFHAAHKNAAWPLWPHLQMDRPAALTTQLYALIKLPTRGNLACRVSFYSPPHPQDVLPTHRLGDCPGKPKYGVSRAAPCSSRTCYVAPPLSPITAAAELGGSLSCLRDDFYGTSGHLNLPQKLRTRGWAVDGATESFSF